MLKLVLTTRMKHDIKVMAKRGKDLAKLQAPLVILASGEPLPAQYKDHQLKGDMKNFRECHIESDWLLIYRIFQDKLILSATATGTHSDLFGA
jgi:mRNA interferase YafQ